MKARKFYGSHDSTFFESNQVFRHQLVLTLYTKFFYTNLLSKYIAEIMFQWFALGEGSIFEETVVKGAQHMTELCIGSGKTIRIIGVDLFQWNQDFFCEFAIESHPQLESAILSRTLFSFSRYSKFCICFFLFVFVYGFF